MSPVKKGDVLKYEPTKTTLDPSDIGMCMPERRRLSTPDIIGLFIVPVYDLRQSKDLTFDWSDLSSFDELEKYRVSEEPEKFCIALVAYYVTKYKKGKHMCVNFNIAWLAQIAK